MNNFIFACCLLSLSFLSANIICPTICVAQEQEADAHADMTKEFDIRTSQESSIQWAENNRKLIQDVLEITVIEDMGKGKFKVKRGHQGEEFIWIMQETSGKTSKGQYVYNSKLIKPISGGVVYTEIYIILTKAGSGTTVKIKMLAGINNPIVNSRLMTIDFVNRLNKCKRLFESHLK